MEIRKLVELSRPIFWPVMFAVFLGGVAVSGAEITAIVVLQLICFTVFYSFFIYGINDIHDYESDRINERKGGVQGAIVEPEERKKVNRYVYLSGLILLATSIATMQPENLFGVSLALFFGHQYSAPPLRFKEKPPLDSISNGFIYLLGPAIAGFSFGKPLAAFPSEAYWLALCGVGLHGYTTIIDYSADREAGDTTLAVNYGKRMPAVLASIIFLTTALFSSLDMTVLRTSIGFYGILFGASTLRPDEKIAYYIASLVYYSGLLLAAFTIWRIMF